MAKYLIAAHPIQQAILDEVAGKSIDSMSLRAIGERVGIEGSPQQIKHHLGQMVKYGFLDVVDGRYRVGRRLKRSSRNG